MNSTSNAADRVKCVIMGDSILSVVGIEEKLQWLQTTGIQVVRGEWSTAVMDYGGLSSSVL